MEKTQEYTRDAYSVAEIHRITGFPKSTIYAGIERGEVPCVRIGEAIRIPGFWLRAHLSPSQQ